MCQRGGNSRQVSKRWNGSLAIPLANASSNGTKPARSSRKCGGAARRDGCRSPLLGRDGVARFGVIRGVAVDLG
jgi:hypothetical protein